MQFINAAVARQNTIFLPLIDIPDNNLSVSTSRREMLAVLEADDACDRVFVPLKHQCCIFILKVPKNHILISRTTHQETLVAVSR